MRRIFLGIVLFTALLSFTGAVFAYKTLPAPSGFVSDFSGVLSNDQRAVLEERLSLFEQETSNEIAVVVVNSLEGDYIEHYAVELFEDWKIGKEGKDNGILFLVALSDRVMRIEVGYGLEGALTDALTVRILNNDVRPFFASGDYANGIVAGVDGIIAATKGEYAGGDSRIFSAFGDWIFYIIFGLLWGGGWLFSIMTVLGRSRSWWAGGVVGGVLGIIAWILIGIWWGGFVASFLVLVGFLLDRSLSRSYQRALALGTIPWWAKKRSGTKGGFWGGGGGSGRGFGGFGGGGSGGGGGSSGW